MQTNSDEITRETIDWKTRALVQLADLQKQIEKVDVENGGPRTLRWMTRTTRELESLNQSIAVSTFIDSLAAAVPSFTALNHSVKSATQAAKRLVLVRR